MEDTVVTFGVTSTLRANTFKLDGYQFGGWNAYSDLTGFWRYVSDSDTTGNWYKEGTQPSGYYKYVYKDQSNLSRTTAVDKEIIILYAIWK